MAVRDADAIDLAQLASRLHASGSPDFADLQSLAIRQFPAGFSNLTYLLTATTANGERRYVLRRPPHGVAGGSAHNMGREWVLLRVLHPRGVPVPRPVIPIDDPSVISSLSYIMEHVDGVILRGAHPSVLSHDPKVAAQTMTALSHAFVDALADLHAVPVAGTPLETLGKPDGYVARQVAGWTDRWQRAQTTAIPTLDAVASWLATHQPSGSDVALIHNDFKFDNLVFDPETLTTVKAILDWEMATIGDPLMDLGTSLAYWVERDDHPIFRTLGLGMTALPGAFTRAELVAAYAARTNRDVQQIGFYYTFGLFKVAVIAQQIFARHVRGLTADDRFARLGAVVDALGARAELVAHTGRL
ncbi:MAG: phosphotransferase family protein [Gemmatimonadaceae bacterium]|nr:phosphotransferase family protein [Gemmatimonadaceae bacterium]